MIKMMKALSKVLVLSLLTLFVFLFPFLSFLSFLDAPSLPSSVVPVPVPVQMDLVVVWKAQIPGKPDGFFVLLSCGLISDALFTGSSHVRIVL